jgi:hypothetical protein
MSAAAAATIEHPMDPPPLQKKKRGAKPNGHRTELDSAIWYAACESYCLHHSHMTHRAFLQSTHYHECQELGSATKSQIVSFGKKLRLYQSNHLTPSARKRQKTAQYTEVEDRLVAFIRLQRHNQSLTSAKTTTNIKSTVQLSWKYLQERALGYAEMERHKQPEKYRDFKASNGWLGRVLKRHDDIRAMNLVKVRKNAANEVDDYE